MDILAISAFNRHKGDIHCPAGINQLYNGTLVIYPEYTGPKDKWYDFYERIFMDECGLTKSQANDTFHTMISTLTLIPTQNDKA